MMKLLFISDIHGSLKYANKAIEVYKNESCDYLIISGDILYHGARNPLPEEYNPKEVANLLNQHATNIIAVRGNCDSEVDEMVLQFPIKAEYNSFFYNGRRIFITHGHIYNEENMPPLNPGDVFVYGHTHILKAEKKGEIIVINPGSITNPKENNPNTYCILEDNVFRVKTFEGEVFREFVL